MKKLILHFTLVLVLLAMAMFSNSTPSFAASEMYQIDAGHSSLLFRIKHLNVAYFYGRFNEMSGSFQFDAQAPENSKIELEVKTESIDSNNANRDRHLKSPDFFSAKQFPTVTFKSTRFEKTETENIYKLTGELSLHGVTKEITANVEHTGSGQASEKFGYRSGFHSVFTIKRSDFGMNYMEGLLGDEVQITLSLEGTKK